MASNESNWQSDYLCELNKMLLIYLYNLCVSLKGMHIFNPIEQT